MVFVTLLGLSDLRIEIIELNLWEEEKTIDWRDFLKDKRERPSKNIRQFEKEMTLDTVRSNWLKFMEKGQDIGNIANEDLSKIREKGMEECINGWMRRGRRRRGITKGEILKE